MTVKNERWKRVAGFPDYWVSSLGRVVSYARTPNNPQFLKPGIASNGYPTVALGRGNTHTLHSLVANAFLGPPPAGQEVRHLDGKRTNPALSNLKYGTRGENIRDAVEHGTWLSPKRRAHLKRFSRAGVIARQAKAKNHVAG